MRKSAKSLIGRKESRNEKLSNRAFNPVSNSTPFPSRSGASSGHQSRWLKRRGLLGGRGRAQQSCSQSVWLCRQPYHFAHSDLSPALPRSLSEASGFRERHHDLYGKSD